MADQKPGFKIDEVEYPFPDAFRLIDPVLVREVTGMNFNDFAEALDDEERRQDPVILVGLVAVAVWQKHKTWKREKVLKYLQQVDIESLEMIDGDEPPAAPGEEERPLGGGSLES